eukprot:CAMPEP_0185033938 /NCGR_PEP_ID=MMETSP1103-20130426/23366_1 /TAXON_ID=36769 /ORGANISM="Paraphysomonas bandaiensis, Strain Caron Lab Isolate" /LENGTH=440 /DNA_ID=CAMNT_0027570389 /DNA_START=66 /DNA_END=1388 /DNA_ORIENTATION=+
MSHIEDKRYNGVIQVFIPQHYQQVFENEWLPDIYDTVISYRGFRKRHVLKLSTSDNYIEYAVILGFDTLNDYTDWVTSSDRLQRVKKLKNIGAFVYKLNDYGGRVQKGAPVESSGNTKPSRISLQNTVSNRPTPRPPAKWKLSIIIVVCIFCALLVVGSGGSITVMRDAGIPLGAVYMLTLMHIIPVLIYSMLPLLMGIQFVNNWLRHPRPPASELHPLLAVLDQGLQMFAPAPVSPVPPAVMQRLNKLEQRLELIRKMNHSLKTRLEDVVPNSTDTANDMMRLESDSRQQLLQRKETHTNEMAEQIGERIRHYDNLKYDEAKGDGIVGPLSLAVRHFVKWECVEDFEQWTDKMDAEMNRYDGYMGMVRIAPKTDGDPFINTFTFDSFDHLSAFAHSAHRCDILRELEPLLEATSIVSLNEVSIGVLRLSHYIIQYSRAF